MQPEIPAIDTDALAELLPSGIALLDVRQPDEYQAGHVPGAVLVPLDQLPERVGEVPRDAPLYVICQAGARSARAVAFLAEQGIEATNVAGGTGAWIAAGREVVTGDSPA